MHVSVTAYQTDDTRSIPRVVWIHASGGIGMRRSVTTSDCYLVELSVNTGLFPAGSQPADRPTSNTTQWRPTDAHIKQSAISPICDSGGQTRSALWELDAAVAVT